MTKQSLKNLQRPHRTIKMKANNLIKSIIAIKNKIGLKTIIGDYKPGYIYGTIKIHKENNSLRPIISQVSSVTYQLVKTLNKIIQPYIPNKYMLKSTSDFIDLIQLKEINGILALLDVVNLFTNVPITDTITIILEHTYKHKSFPSRDMPQEILKSLLQLCTKESPFKTPEGTLYKQIEGVTMGSPLGSTFANFYMGHLKNAIFENSNIKSTLYARYVDNIFLEVDSEEQLIKIKEAMESRSVLKITYELRLNKKLPFLDEQKQLNKNN